MQKESYPISKTSGITTILIAGLSDDKFNEVKNQSDFRFPNHNCHTVAFENPAFATVVIGDNGSLSLAISINEDTIKFNDPKAIHLIFTSIDAAKVTYGKIATKQLISAPSRIPSSRFEYANGDGQTVSSNDVGIFMAKEDGTHVHLCGLDDHHAPKGISIISPSMDFMGAMKMSN